MWRVGACCLALLLLGLGTPASAATLVLSDFEDGADLSQWSATDGAVLTLVASHVTHGAQSCQVDLPVTTYPGMWCERLSVHDWSGYDVLRFDVYNPNGFALALHLELGDPLSTDWPTRYYQQFTVVPGNNEIEVDLHHLLRVNGVDSVDVTNITRFLFYFSGHSAPTQVFVDYVRLETVQDNPDADAARGIYKFDFGTETSPRWPDFYRISEGAAYDYPMGAGQPFGWDTAAWRRASDEGGPDDLCRDAVHPLPCCPDENGASIDFGLDVPNGTYHVYVVARSGNFSDFPIMGYKISAEGEVKVNVPMDSATFYSTDYFYRGMDRDYPYPASAWELFEQPNYPAHRFTVAVADGHLNLRFTYAWAYALIVYPDSPEIVAEMEGRLADLEAQRRAQFEGNYFINQPESRTFTPTPEEAGRGYALWPGEVAEACYPDTLPPDPRPALALETAACWEERRVLSLALRPLDALTDVSATASDLSDGLGHVIASSAITISYLRYLPTPDSEFFGAGVLSWKPRLLQRDFPIAVHGQVTKELWIEIRIPAATPAGLYTGAVTVHSSAGDVAVPLAVRVYAFSLDDADDVAYGWYYLPPESQYSIDTRFFPDLAARPDELLRQDLQFMKDYGFNSLEFQTPGVMLSGGAVTGVDTSGLERYLTAMREVGFSGDWTGQFDAYRLASYLMGDGGLTEFTGQFNTAFKEALRRVVEWGQTPAGAPLVFYLMDEPREVAGAPWNRNFADTMQYVTLANQVPGAVNSVHLMRDLQDGVDYTSFADVLQVMQTHPWPPSATLIGRAHALGRPNWFYNTGGDLRMVFGFFQYGWGGGNGAWEWHYDWLDGGMFDTYPYSPFNNHWRYTYPSPDGPVPTLDFVRASEGIWDYRYAKTLDRLAGEAAASGDPALMDWAVEAESLLTAIRTDTPTYAVDSSYRAQHFAGTTSAAEAEGAMEAYRRQAAEMIAALPSPIPPPEAEVTGTALPARLLWETAGAGTVAIQNLGASPWTVGSYGLRASSGIDRWGLVALPLSADVAPGGTATFPLSLAAPPVSTLCYPAGAMDNDPPMTDGLSLYLGMAHGIDPVPGGTAMGEIAISRFPDGQPGTDGGWARPQIEECAGRVPRIVGGYPDGSYGPRIEVTREQMAVFIQRALDLALTSHEGRFPDVPGSNWAALPIEALARAGIVSGYPSGAYEPLVVVTRDQMAVFIARGMAGSDGAVPLGPATPTFPDVPTGSWAYKHIEYAVTQHVVAGYPDGSYHPDITVTRDQMAVFIFRAFLQPRSCAVVLAGPAVTAQDPATGGACGWASTATASAGVPGHAYVTFDALRLGTKVAFGGTWEVKFELRFGAAPDLPAAGPYTWTRSVTPTEITEAKAAAAAHGDPYWPIAWGIPAGLLPGDYVLVVSVEDQNGNLREMGRRPAVALTGP